MDPRSGRVVRKDASVELTVVIEKSQDGSVRAEIWNISNTGDLSFMDMMAVLRAAEHFVSSTKYPEHPVVNRAPAPTPEGRRPDTPG